MVIVSTVILRFGQLQFLDQVCGGNNSFKRPLSQRAFYVLYLTVLIQFPVRFP